MESKVKTIKGFDIEKLTTEYEMAPNITIYQGDNLKLENGQVRLATLLDGDPDRLILDRVPFGMDDEREILNKMIIGPGKDQYKIAAEYKVSGDEPVGIKVYERTDIVFGVQEDEAVKTGDGLQILGKITEPYKGEVEVEVLITKQEE
jgi:hypothetical protein